MAARPRYDVIVMDVADPALALRMIADLLYHLREGGRLVVASSPLEASGTVRLGHRQSNILGFIAAVADPAPQQSLRALAQSLQMTGHDLRVLQKSLRLVEASGEAIVLTSNRVARAKLNETAVNEYLEITGTGRVLTTVSGTRWTSRAQLRESAPRGSEAWASEWEAPAACLRAYDGAICAPGQVAISGRCFLPDTYRHIGRPRLKNQNVTEVAPLFASAAIGRPTKRLPGSYFYWDSEFRGHFGHAITEQLSRMWAYEHARATHPDLKIFMTVNKGRGLSTIEKEILTRSGVRMEDVVIEDGPVRVERLLAATPMFSQPTFVHPDIADVWDRIGASLARAAPDRHYPDRIFVARRITKRGCRNAAAVEALFAGHGFEVIYPEDHPPTVQARLFREASVIAGYAGSGLFTAMFATEPKHLIMISSTSYVAQNEWLIAGVRGHRVDVSWSAADRSPRAGAPPRWLIHSPFTVDMEHEGRFLKQVLAEL